MRIIYWLIIIISISITGFVYYGLTLEGAPHNIYSISFMLLAPSLMCIYGLWVKSIKYKGGTTSFIGVINLILWLFILIRYIEKKIIGTEDATALIGATAISLTLGLALIIAGNKLHKERKYMHVKTPNK